MKLVKITQKLPQVAILIAIVVLVGIRTKNAPINAQKTHIHDTELEASLKKSEPNISYLTKLGEDEWEIRNKDSKKVGKVVVAKNSTSHIIGYGGPIPLAIIIDKENKIRNIVVLANSETPSFLERVIESGFLSSWIGLPVEQAISKDVDAISGATYSSVAINETVKTRLAQYNNAQVASRKINLKTVFQFLLIGIVLIWALLCYFRSKAMANNRLFLLAASIGILGFFYGSFLSIKLISGWFIQGVSLNNQVIFITMAFLAIVLPLLFGKNFYCSYICPFGACQELIGKLNTKKATIPTQLNNILLHTRSKILLVVILLIAIYGATIDVTSAEPFSAFLFSSASKGVVIMAIVILIISIFIPRPWCRFFCPTGALIAFFAKDSRFIFKNGLSFTGHLAATAFALVFIFHVFGENIGSIISSAFEKNSKEIVMNNIFSRKSVRHFTDKEVSRSNLELLMKAGMAAPTAKNRQPWAFIAITERNVLDSLAIVLPYGKMLYKAPSAIVVCGDLTKTHKGDGNRWVMDCSAATQNILLAAESMELGAVWVGVYPDSTRTSNVQQLLKLPDTAQPLCVVAVGYPTGEDKPMDKFNENNIHWEEWK